MSKPEGKIVQFDEGWSLIEKHLKDRVATLETQPDKRTDAQVYMHLYSTVYTMCTQSDPHDYSRPLYDKYRAVFQSYCPLVALPRLRGQHGEALLREFVDRWAKYKILGRWMSHVFHYLEVYFVHRKCLVGLKEVMLSCFRELVYREVSVNVREAVMGLIRKQREGELIDSGLLKNVMDVFREMELPASELDFGEQYLAEYVDNMKL